MKKLYLIVLIICLQTFALSENNPKISILTCSPGDEVYSVFGHTAIRVKQPETGVDFVFNFGMFDFSTHHFALQFAKGSLRYALGVQYMEDFMVEYDDENRQVTEQLLNLADPQKKRLVYLLDSLYQPENRYYRYAFIERNCATEVRDLLEEIGIAFPRDPLPCTDRDLINSYLSRHSWLRFGINLSLGRTIDHPTTTYRSMFLPDYLHDELEKTNQGSQNVILEQRQLNPLAKQPVKADGWYSPLLLFSLLFILSLLIRHKAFPAVLFSIIGLTGLVLLALNLFSLHQEVKQNFNMLWCNPLYVLYVPFLIRGKIPRWLPVVFLSTLALALGIWITGFQVFDRVILPLLFMLAWLNADLYSGGRLRRRCCRAIRRGRDTNPPSFQTPRQI